MLSRMKVLLLQLDGKLPNLALMRISAHHRERGDAVELVQHRVPGELLGSWDRVYVSALFDSSRPMVEEARQRFRDKAVFGGPAIDGHITLYTSRGCRSSCPFCVVPRVEGRPRSESTVAMLWRGGNSPRQLILLDADFFGQPEWHERCAELSGYRVSFCQGINARRLTEEQAAAIARLDYRALNLRDRRLYVAWDRRQDEAAVVRGISRLLAAGVRRSHLMCYMLIGFGQAEVHEDRDYRRRRLRELGVTPYPMPYRRTTELIGFCRWVASGMDRTVSWADWVGARYRPRNVRRRLRRACREMF
jgi:hypothetical protein